MQIETQSMRGTNWHSVLRSRAFLWIAIPLLWALAYLPAIGARDLRLEEGRRATPAREMLYSGDFIRPTLYGEPYLSKPPLFFWIAAGMGKLQGGVNQLSVRIPSVLSVLLGVWLLARFAPGVLKREIRVLAALIFMSMPIMLDKGTLGEIDAVLSLIVFAALAWWWKFYDPDRARVALIGWLGAGILLGLSILMKGPGGFAEFYAVAAGFALFGGRGKWKILFSAGHLFMLIVALLPVALWVWALLGNTDMSWNDLAAIWAHQTGADVLAGAGPQGVWKRLLVEHYLLLPFRALSDLLPWIIIGLAGAWSIRKDPVADEPKSSRDLWRLLVASWPTLLLVFWLWPKGTPRYMMMGAYPVALLAAWVIAGRWDVSHSAKVTGFLRSAGSFMALCTGMLGGAAIMLSIQLKPGGLGTTILVVAASLILAVWAMWLTRRTPIEHAAVACACNFAMLILLGWGMLTSVFLPAKAATDPTRIIHRQIEEIVPHGLPIFTTRTFRSGKGNDYYNAQFYLPGDPPRALNDFSELRPGEKAIVLLSPAEWKDAPNNLLAIVPDARELGRLDATRKKKKGAPPHRSSLPKFSENNCYNNAAPPGGHQPLAASLRYLLSDAKIK